jgi:hypothetical protein
MISRARRAIAVRFVRLRSRLGAMTMTDPAPDPQPAEPVPGQPPAPESPETPDDDPQPDQQSLLRKQRKPSGPSRAEV